MDSVTKHRWNCVLGKLIDGWDENIKNGILKQKRARGVWTGFSWLRPLSAKAGYYEHDYEFQEFLIFEQFLVIRAALHATQGVFRIYISIRNVACYPK